MRARLVPAIWLILVATPALAVNWMPPPPCPRPGSTVSRPPPSPQLVAARRAEHLACAADMQRFCANVPTGCGRPMICLRSHAGEVSAECASALQQLRAVHAENR